MEASRTLNRKLIIESTLTGYFMKVVSPPFELRAVEKVTHLQYILYSSAM